MISVVDKGPNGPRVQLAVAELVINVLDIDHCNGQALTSPMVGQSLSCGHEISMRHQQIVGLVGDSMQSRSDVTAERTNVVNCLQRGYKKGTLASHSLAKPSSVSSRPLRT